MAEDRIAVDRFEVKMYIGVTVRVNGDDWLKPGVGSSCSWPGLPDPDQIEAAMEYQTHTTIEPALAGFLKIIQEKMIEKGLK